MRSVRCRSNEQAAACEIGLHSVAQARQVVVRLGRRLDEPSVDLVHVGPNGRVVKPPLLIVKLVARIVGLVIFPSAIAASTSERSSCRRFTPTEVAGRLRQRGARRQQSQTAGYRHVLLHHA